MLCTFAADAKGNPMPAPPLIREIAKHPKLSQVHLIAEPWDLGMYQVGCGCMHHEWGGQGWQQQHKAALQEGSCRP